MVPLRVSITKFEWLPDDPTAFVPSMLWKLLFITTWDDSQNRSHPTDSAEEAEKVKGLFNQELSQAQAGPRSRGSGPPLTGKVAAAQTHDRGTTARAAKARGRKEPVEGGNARTVVPFLSCPEAQKLRFQRRGPRRCAPWSFSP